MKRDFPYTLLSHTADLGMRVKGDSCEGLFRNAGMALTDIMILNKAPEPGEKKDISIKGNDLPDLMVKWLSEILYLFEGEDLITTEIAVNQMSESSINSTLITVGFDARYHEVLREIKAITYHQVEVREDEGLWTARVIFDL
ncbi:MAG: archease [Desulfatiglans sp.]|jgi:SHS2 domain-containing protein|nr:archease [Desulfatiglans sp.]